MPVDPHYIEIGARVRALRESYRYTRDAFAEKIDTSTKFLYEIETGKKGFTVETLSKMSKVLDVTSDYIIDGEKAQKVPREVIKVLESFEPEQYEYIEDILLSVQDMLGEQKE